MIRNSSLPPKKKIKPGTIKYRNLISSSCESLSARGFLRSLKPYKPPDNVVETVREICQKILGPNFDVKTDLSREDKFSLLTTCYKELNHCVPNSLLHKINNVNDVFDFYKTPVVTTTPYDELVSQDLPPNLHIQQNYIRFNPESDTKFKGISAFPQNSAIVTGLKYKEKYKGYKAPDPDIYYNRAEYIKENAFE